MRALRPHILPFLSLFLLVGLTLGASYLPMGTWNGLVALSISLTQAIIIGLYFMELRKEDNLNRIVAVVGLLWLGFLLMMALTDVWNRFPGRLLG